MTNVIFVERVAMVVCQTVSKEVFASIVSRDSWLTEKYLCCDGWLVQPPTPLATLVFRYVNGSKLKTHQWTLVCNSSHTTATAFFLKKSSENITQDLSSPTHDMGLPWRKSISAVPLIVLILALSQTKAAFKAQTSFPWNDVFEPAFPQVSTHLCRGKYVHFNGLDHVRRSTIFSYLAVTNKNPARYGVVKVFILGKELRAHACLARATKGCSGLEKFRSQQVMLEMQDKYPISSTKTKFRKCIDIRAYKNSQSFKDADVTIPAKGSAYLRRVSCRTISLHFVLWLELFSSSFL